MEDVRVKLSAEGVSEIVSALQRIRNEAKKTGDEGATAFDKLTDAVKKHAGALVAAFTVGAIISKFKGLTDEVANSALAMGKLAKATGLSTDAVQVYMKAAGPSEAAQEALNKGLSKFAVIAGQAELGSQKASAGLTQLGIKASDFNKLSMDQKLELVGKKLAGVQDPSLKAAIGVELFGKNAQQMMGALDKVSREGFGTFLDKLKSMGLYMSQDTIDAMKRVKKQMGEMGETSKGLATQFLVGLLPGVQAAMDGLVKDTNKGASGFQMFGEKVGWLVNVVAKGFQVIGAAVGEGLAKAFSGFEKQAEILQSSASLWEKAKASFKLSTGLSVFSGDTTFDQTKAAAAEFAKAFSEGPKPQAPKKDDADNPHTDVITDMRALSSARLALLNAQLDAERAVFEAHAKLMEANDREQYEAGKLSLEDYYSRRRSIIESRSDDEIRILQSKRKAAAAQPIGLNDDGSGAIHKQAELARIDGEIAAKQIERQINLSQLAQQQRADALKLYEDQQAAVQKLLTMEGKRAEAAKLQLQIEKEKLQLELQKSGRPQGEIDDVLAAHEQQALAKIDYDEAKRDADTTLTGLTTQIKAIQDQVKGGLLFPIQGEQKIMQLERERLPVLEQTAKHLEELAKQTKDPQVLEQAEQFKLKIQEIKTATDEAGQQMARLKQTAEDAFQGGLSDFLYQVGTGQKNLVQGFRDMALSFAQSLAKMESEFLSKQFIKWLNGQGGGGGGPLGALNTFLNSSGGAGGAAGGTSLTAAGTTLTTAGTSLTSAAAALTASAEAMQAGGAAGGGGGGFGGLLGGLFSGGGGADAAEGADFSDFADVFAATGGHIRGAGTSTSDSIPAMLSDGEFVVNSAAVAKPGMLALLHAINGTPGYSRGPAPGGVQRYATGGAVGGGGGMSVKIVNVPDSSLLANHLDTQVGEQQVLNILAKNPSRVRAALG